MRTLQTFTIVAGAFAGVIAIGQAQSLDQDRGQARTVEQRVAARPGGRVTIDVETGGAVVVHGSADDWVRLRVVARGRDRAVLNPTLTSASGRAQVHLGPGNRGLLVDAVLDVWVPAETDVRLTSAGGPITVYGVKGALTGETNAGDLTLREVQGTATLETGAGRIDVSDASLDGTIRTRAGTAELRGVTGDLTVVTPTDVLRATPGPAYRPTAPAPATRPAAWSGRASYRAEWTGACGDPGPSPGALVITRLGGSITVPEAPHGAYLTTPGGSIDVGRNGGVLTAFTGGGDVGVRDAEGDVNVGTGGGTVAVTVVNKGSAVHTVRICSGGGPVVLNVPTDLDATLRLEIAVTPQARRTPQITADVPLTTGAAQDWDGPGATPLHLIRATTTLGRGRGTIAVQTTNSDIVVRRR